MIIDGRKIADKVLENLKDKITVLQKNRNKPLRLAAVLVGNDPEFQKFVELKSKKAKQVGIEFPVYQLSEDITNEELIKKMTQVSDISDGALIELPLPEQLDTQAILNQIPIEKDVDVLSFEAQKLFYENKSKINPPAVEALRIVFEEYDIDVKNKNVAVFGQGILVGKPIAHWLEYGGAKVSRIRSKTENPEKLSLNADIVITGVGKPNLISGDMIKNGAVVIDFGYGRIDNKMVGDVDFNSVCKKASLITPVPGGIGPILVVTVIKNLVTLSG